MTFMQPNEEILCYLIVDSCIVMSRIMRRRLESYEQYESYEITDRITQCRNTRMYVQSDKHEYPCGTFFFFLFPKYTTDPSC